MIEGAKETHKMTHKMPLFVKAHHPDVVPAVGSLDALLEIEVLDGVGPGGAYHEYEIHVPEPADGAPRPLCVVNFQRGPVREVGVNGISIESLLAIVQHRLECFQGGAFACGENEQALASVRAAMAELHKRTARRVAAGTEGTSAPDGDLGA